MVCLSLCHSGQPSQPMVHNEWTPHACTQSAFYRLHYLVPMWTLYCKPIRVKITLKCKYCRDHNISACISGITYPEHEHNMDDSKLDFCDSSPLFVFLWRGQGSPNNIQTQYFEHFRLLGIWGTGSLGNVIRPPGIEDASAHDGPSNFLVFAVSDSFEPQIRTPSHAAQMRLTFWKLSKAEFLGASRDCLSPRVLLHSIELVSWLQSEATLSPSPAFFSSFFPTEKRTVNFTFLPRRKFIKKVTE